MTTPRLYRRVLRRETHSPRSGLATGLAVVLILILAWIGVESILALFGRPALIIAPAAAVTGLTLVPRAILTPFIVAGGVLVAVVGFVILLFSFLPGRRARHTGTTGRTAVVVDNAAIASSLARTASAAANVDPDQVIVTVGHRTALVRVRPTSGFPVDESGILDAVTAEIGEFDLAPALRSRVVIDRKGIVGA